MYENLSASDIANQISMLRSAFKGTIVVVEGVTDSRLYGKFIDKDDVKTIIAYSKDNVRRSVSECWGKRNDHDIIGIMDADLDRLNGKDYAPPLFISDNRDMETMILSTDALDSVLAEYADIEALERFEKKNGTVRDAIAKGSYPIGLLMYISLRDGLGMSFKDIDHRFFIDRKTLAIDIDKMLTEIYAQSVNQRISKKNMADMIAAEEELLDDPWHAARGHDAVAVLLIGLTDTFGSYNCRGMKSGELGGALRLAFGFDSFRETELYADSRKWAEKRGISLWAIPDH